MSQLVMASGDPQTLVSHLALYGLLSILEEAAPNAVVRGWWSGGMAPRPVVEVEAPGEEIGEMVRVHAAKRALESKWPAARAPHRDSALLSPRMTAPEGRKAWSDLLQARHGVVDALTGDRAILDLRMIGGLGELSHWHRDRRGQPRLDRAASRYDMQARNRGNDLVRIKVAPLAKIVAARTASAVADGLVGRTQTDELAGASPGRSATGFAPLGFVDNAVAWCAFWGLSAVPVAPRAGRPSVTSTVLPRVAGRLESVVVPLWRSPMRPARLRALLADGRLVDTADGTIDSEGARGMAGADESVARWLAAIGVAALVRFPIEVHGSQNAPERRAARGVLRVDRG
jgi:CRISPR-associated protein Csb3